MNEIYPMWVAAHGIMIVTPVNWYHAPTGLKAMIDRLVCADGCNPDPSSTHGKKPDEAKALELKGWPYPRHLAGRYLRVHGLADQEMLLSWVRLVADSSVRSGCSHPNPLIGTAARRSRLPRERFSRVPGMLNSSEVKVFHPT
jgi:hypothetical protein